MVTFEQARERAEALRRDWQGPGLFYVAPWGYDLGDDWLVLVGAHEGIMGGQIEYVPLDDQQTLVDKRTGILRHESALGRLDDELVPVGDWSQAPTD